MADSASGASADSTAGGQAGYGRRLLAFLIDGVAGSLVARIFTHPPSLGYSLGVTVIFFAQRVIFTPLVGGSLGQVLVRERVVSVRGGRATFGQAAIRTGLMLAFLVPVFFVDREGRGLHDRAAGTDVIAI